MGTVPPLRPPTATPIQAFGNNTAVACPCGSIVVVPGRRSHCACGRRYEFHFSKVPEERLLDVYDDPKSEDVTYRVQVGVIQMGADDWRERFTNKK